MTEMVDDYNCERDDNGYGVGGWHGVAFGRVIETHMGGGRVGLL